MVGSRSPFSGSVTVPLPSLTTTRRIPGKREPAFPRFAADPLRRHCVCLFLRASIPSSRGGIPSPVAAEMKWTSPAG